MPTEEHPDIEKFMSDPKFAKDRDFFQALIAKTMEQRAAESRAKAAPEATSVWDFLFWKPKTDAEVSMFDRLFGGK